MAKKKTKTNPDLTILQGIQAERYWPQLNQIRDLDRQADEQYRSDIDSARATALSSTLQANKAIPEIQSLYKGARGQTDFDNAQANSVIKNTGVAGDVFKNALAREERTARSGITSAGTSAITDLKNQIVSAAAGKQQGFAQARKAKAKTKDLLQTRLSDILREQGATSAATLTELQNARVTAEGKATEEKNKTQADADEKARKEKVKADEKKAAHVGEVHKATGDFKVKIENAIGSWEQFSKRSQQKVKAVKDDDGKWVEEPQFDAKGNPIMAPATPSQIKDLMIDAGYTPGEIHIALLRRVGKPLDPAARRYMAGLSGVRIPREWLRNQMENRIRSGDAAGPPAPDPR